MQSERYPGLKVGKDVELGRDLVVGGNVVVYSGTVVGDGCELQDGAVLGKYPRLGKRSQARRDARYKPLVVEQGAAICTNAVVFAGSSIGAEAIVGDQSHVRERSTVGPQTVIGRGTSIDNHVTLGARVRVQSMCYLTAFSTVEDDVFIAPGVVTTNDNTMGRHGQEHRLRGALLGRACRVGAGAVLLPGVEIGEEAFVAAGALVTRDVPVQAVVKGVPAKRVGEVPDADLLEQWL